LSWLLDVPSGIGGDGPIITRGDAVCFARIGGIQTQFRTIQTFSDESQDCSPFARVSYTWRQNEMRRTNRGVFQIGALVFTICAAFTTGAVQATQPAQKKAGIARLPAPGEYKIDPVHSFTYFGAWHHVVGLVRGRFERVNGTIIVAPDAADCSVDITIDASSISTQNSDRDDDLRSPDFFDVKKFPVMTYRGRGIRRVGSNWMLDGSLTIRSVTKVVPLQFNFNGVFPDLPADKPVRAAFHGAAATKRGDFGMTRDNLMELGVSPSGPDVAIQIDVEADKLPDSGKRASDAVQGKGPGFENLRTVRIETESRGELKRAAVSFPAVQP
jgi:polyisoprenoid-binding protein YceI